MLNHGDTLLLEDGARVRILAAEEDLLDIRARDAVHLTELPAYRQPAPGGRDRLDRIRILRDHVPPMLETLGATVADTRGRFVPVRVSFETKLNQAHTKKKKRIAYLECGHNVGDVPPAAALPRPRIGRWAGARRAPLFRRSA